MIFQEMLDDFIAHYGTPWDGIMNSGRYKYGSGKNPYQRSLDFRGMVEQMRSSGEFKNDTEIARGLGMSSDQFRKFNSISKNEIDKHNIAEAQKLKEKRMSNSAIAEKLGLSGESQVRNLLKRGDSGRVEKTKEISDILQKQCDEKKYLDVGSGVENQLGISQTRLKTACTMLETKGYRVENIYIPQATNPKQKTTVKVLVKADPKATDNEVKHDIYEHRDQILSVSGIYKDSTTRTLRNVEPPVQIDPKRVKVRYCDDKDHNGIKGVDKDGTIELRRGVEDISLGNAHYAQVRIDVGGTNYLKGMAVYGDDKDFPPGVDIIFNTNKDKSHPMLGSKADDPVLKPLKIDKSTGKVDQENPFGASIKNQDQLILAQQFYVGKDGKQHQSALNIVNEEGNWGNWKKAIASQFLSKQPVSTAQKQLKIAEDRSRMELDEIEHLTNPVVRKKLLDTFASSADSAAVDLKGAKFPRQSSQVIIPINSLKPTEIYAPNYKDGEEVILVRYPHGGKFESPRLVVNNRNKEGKMIITPNAKDAVGINHQTAAQLSGADFDGDTVLVIPTKGQNLKTSKIQSLIDFEPQNDFKAYKGMTPVGQGPGKDGFQKQKQMGMISNLITDMTIQGASIPEITRAVKHSMVIIDAEKHQLDWHRSEREFGIDQLREKYQKKANGKSGGAATLISRASGQKRVDERGALVKTDPATGKLIFRETGRAYDKGNYILSSKIDKATGKPKKIYKEIYIRDGKTYEKVGKDYVLYSPKGKVVKRQSLTTPMADTDDARTLISANGSKIENVYAAYANSMKAMANEARKASYATKMPSRDPKARLLYSQEVESLSHKLDQAKINAPRERQAQLIASKNIEIAKKQNPDKYEDKDDEKKMRQQFLKGARNRTGASRYEITITDKEWEAIQHNAISSSKLSEILDHADLDSVRKLATPKEDKKLTNARISRIKSLANLGYTNSEIADDLGVSVSTVQNYLD